jgi:hypothetical protein
MIQEAEKRHYRGVLCLFCRQPIPLSTKLANLEDANQDIGPDSAQERLSRVISVRCGDCQKEAPYRVSEFADFEGTPKQKGSRNRPIVVPWRRLAKAAGT